MSAFQAVDLSALRWVATTALEMAALKVANSVSQWVVELAGWTAVSLAELTAASTALGMEEVKAVSSAV